MSTFACELVDLRETCVQKSGQKSVIQMGALGEDATKNTLPHVGLVVQLRTLVRGALVSCVAAHCEQYVLHSMYDLGAENVQDPNYASGLV